MDNNQILKAILALPELERLKLINELTGKTVKQDYISVRWATSSTKFCSISNKP